MQSGTDDKFIAAQRIDDIEEMHKLWCWAAETFLWRTDDFAMSPQLPVHKPRRGQVLPMVPQPIANKINDVTRTARNNFTKHLANVTGTLSDICARAKRLQGLHECSKKSKEECAKLRGSNIQFGISGTGPNISDTAKVPSDYDMEVVPKTLERSLALMRKLWDHPARRDAENKGCDDLESSPCIFEPSTTIPLDWQFMLNVVTGDDSSITSCTFSVNSVHAAISAVRGFAKKITNFLRRKRTDEGKRRGGKA